MANPFKGEVSIELGEKCRRILFDMNSIAELENTLHMPMSVAFGKERAGVHVIRQALYVGLQGGGMRKVTIRQVGRWMTPTEDRPDLLEEIGDAVGSALSLALGVDLNDEGDGGVIAGEFSDAKTPEVIDADPLELKEAPKPAAGVG